jgi:hypothetical protein
MMKEESGTRETGGVIDVGLEVISNNNLCIENCVEAQPLFKLSS